MKALIMVDLQNDFCRGGGLAVPQGDEVVAIANRLQEHFDCIIASKDWHPVDHMSFASNHPGRKIGDIVQEGALQQILWPNHCVQESHGSEFHPQLDIIKINKIIYKGTEKNIDSYSTFFDNAHLRATGLGDYLQENNIHEIYIMGLATDYCVKYSCLDAIRLGFETYIIQDACRGVELSPGDIKNALSEMKAAGANIINSTEVAQ